jgi:hypothetical protein
MSPYTPSGCGSPQSRNLGALSIFTYTPHRQLNLCTAPAFESVKHYLNTSFYWSKADCCICWWLPTIEFLKSMPHWLELFGLRLLPLLKPSEWAAPGGMFLLGMDLNLPMLPIPNACFSVHQVTLLIFGPVPPNSSFQRRTNATANHPNSMRLCENLWDDAVQQVIFRPGILKHSHVLCQVLVQALPFRPIQFFRPILLLPPA